MSIRAVLYLRVSTDEQTTENQRQALEAIATARDWTITKVYEDAAVSGSKGRDKRPGLDALLRDAVKHKFDVVMVWAVDRLGRSLSDLLNTLTIIENSKANIFIHQQALDTTTPTGRLMFQMLGAFAEFERVMIVERVKAGLKRARKQGKTLGRPKTPADIEAGIREGLQAGEGMLRLAKRFEVGSGTVQRIKAEMLAETLVASA